MNSAALEGIIKIFLVLILVSATFITTRRNILSFFRTYSIQSFFIAAVALFLFFQENSQMLLYVALLTLASKVVFIPLILARIQRSMKIHRDVEFHYLKPGGSLAASISLIFLSYMLFSRLLPELGGNIFLYRGAVIGFSLMLIGMLIVFSRKLLITKIVGYLTMENGVVLFSIFIAELPFLLEVLVLMDLIMIVMVAAILGFGITSSVEEFHAKLNPFRGWLNGGNGND